MNPTAWQVVRAHRTITTRTERTIQALNQGTARGWMVSGVRRAKRKAKRLMCEYFGVGDPIQILTTYQVHEVDAFNDSAHNYTHRAFRTEMMRDRVFTRFSTKGF